LRRRSRAYIDDDNSGIALDRRRLARSTNPAPRPSRTHWPAISDLHRNLIDYTPVPAGANLAEVMRATIAWLAREGRAAEDDDWHGSLFINWGGARRLVKFTSVDPQASYGGVHSHLTGRGAGELVPR
jgi:hypothetical protein